MQHASRIWCAVWSDHRITLDRIPNAWDRRVPPPGESRDRYGLLAGQLDEIDTKHLGQANQHRQTGREQTGGFHSLHPVRAPANQAAKHGTRHALPLTVPFEPVTERNGVDHR
jgi:hypothetical protein